MRGILVKIGLFLEAHVEKIILALFGALSLWLLFVWVAFSPNKVTLPSGSTESPGQVDETIKRLYTGDVETVLDQPPEGKDGYQPKLNSRIDPNDGVVESVRGRLDQGLMGIYSDVLGHLPQASLPLPGRRGVMVGEGKQYHLPPMGRVTDLKVEHIRAAAYIPMEPLSEDLAYNNAESEPNDLDLVTVQGQFDVGLLRARFYESFASEALPEDWRDPAIAKPVFAAVDLQRQERLADGTWTDWTSLPRPLIDQYADLFEIVEDVDLLPPGGVRARMLKLDQEQLRMSLLQPEGYAFASAYEEWYPPELHQEYLQAREKERLQERREERESRGNALGRGNDARGNDRAGARGRAGANARGQDRRGAANGARAGARVGRAGAQRGGNVYGGGAEAGGRGRGAQTESDMDKVNKKLREMLIKSGTTVEDMEDLVFWSHDDGVEAGKTYRYRLRLGVVNPVAGTNNMAQEYLDLQSQPILWSELSEATEPIHIPERGYFFVRDFQDATGEATVEVAKFYLGYWRSEEFKVARGEVIGHVVEKEPEEEESLTRGGRPGMFMDMGRNRDSDEVTSDPLEIDYSTNAFFVDAVRVEDWNHGIRMRPQIYHAALYSQDGETLEQVAIGSSNWPEELSDVYGVIKRAQREEVEEFKGFDLGAMGTRGATSNRGGRGLYGEIGAYGG